jgi:Mlc titration factor MtfA (ptsG expression regulator)
MDRVLWSRVFGAAFEEFRDRVERGERTAIDPYAAENPGEFFAVMSEAFFEIPGAVLAGYGEVYCHLAAFYRQDPAARAGARPAAARAEIA